MTTFKQCRACQKIVRWEPPAPEEHNGVHFLYLTCRGGNAPFHCPGTIARAPAPAGAGQFQPVARRTGGMTLEEWLDWFTRHPDATAPSGVAGMLVQEIHLLRERQSSYE